MVTPVRLGAGPGADVLHHLPGSPAALAVSAIALRPCPEVVRRFALQAGCDADEVAIARRRGGLVEVARRNPCPVPVFSVLAVLELVVRGAAHRPELNGDGCFRHSTQPHLPHFGSGQFLRERPAGMENGRENDCAGKGQRHEERPQAASGHKRTGQSNRGVQSVPCSPCEPGRRRPLRDFTARLPDAPSCHDLARAQQSRLLRLCAGKRLTGFPSSDSASV